MKPISEAAPAELTYYEITSLFLRFTRDLRMRSCLSQAQLASILGLRSHGSIHAIETGKVCPRLDTFLRILSVFNYCLVVAEPSAEMLPAPSSVSNLNIEIPPDIRIRLCEDAACSLQREIKRIRLSFGMSQAYLAAELGGKSHGGINAIETGKTFPRLDTFIRILAALRHTAVIRESLSFNDQVGH